MEYATKEELNALATKLTKHEALDAKEYAALGDLCHAAAEKASYPSRSDKMSEGINTDKVIVNAGSGGGDAGNMAAVIAALGNRNQGNDNAALIAALGQRNETSSLIPLLAALGNRNEGYRHSDDGIGFGGNSGILGLIAMMSLFRGRGLGGDDCCHDDHDGNHARVAMLQTLQEGLADQRAEFPKVVLEANNAIKGDLAQLALGVSQGLSNLKDTVQNSATINLVATKEVLKEVESNALKNQIAITADGDKTRALLIQFNTDNLNRELTVCQSRLHSEEHHRHADGVEARMTQTVIQGQNQNQAQSQYQRLEDDRYNRLCNVIAALGNQVQRTRSDQDLVNFGTMVASGTQAASSTQVR
jgi:hypothetical protein